MNNEDNINIEAYFRVGYVSSDKDYLSDGEKAIVYSSVDKNKIVTDFIYVYNSEENFKVNKSNYEEFSQYKITFTNSDGGYFFKSIERTK